MDILGGRAVKGIRNNMNETENKNSLSDKMQDHRSGLMKPRSPKLLAPKLKGQVTWSQNRLVRKNRLGFEFWHVK